MPVSEGASSGPSRNPFPAGPSFFDHLDELRTRVLWCLSVFVIAVAGLFPFSGTVMDLLVRPVGRLVFTSPQDAFLARMTVALWTGFVAALPFILFHVWQFVALGLTPAERKHIRVFGPLSLVFFLCGALFAYFVLVPMSLNFLMSFASQRVQPMIMVDKYISFMTGLIIACGVTFEMPLILGFLARVGIASPEFLRQKRRYAIVLILVLAAVLTPPDIISQLILSVPLLILYEMGIWGARLMYRGGGG